MATSPKKSKASKKTPAKKITKAAKSEASSKRSSVIKSPILLKSNTKDDFLEQLGNLKRAKSKTKLSTEPTLTLRNNLSLALLSPYRLPIDANKIAMQSARIAGMAFVVIGAVLTMFNLPAVNVELAKNASQTEQAAQLLAYEPNDGSCAGCESHQINTYRFSASVSISENIETQIYSIKIVTSGASKIELRQVDSSGKTQHLGYASKASSGSSTWVYDWNVASVPEGSYKVYGIVTNYKGVYTTTRVSTNVKHNEPEPETETNTESTTSENSESSTDSTTTNTNTTTNTFPTETTEPIDFKVSVDNASELEGLAEVAVTVEGASAVELYVLPKNATTPRYLGLASIKAKNEWSYLWNTANTPNGDYRLYAVAKLISGKTNSPYRSVTVANEIVSTLEPEETEVVNAEDTSETEPVVVLPPPPPPIYQEAEQTITAIEDQIDSENFAASVEEIITLIPSPEEIDSIEVQLKQLMGEYQVDIQNEIENLKLAIRSGDQEQIDLVVSRIEELQNKMIKNSFTIGNEGLLSFVGQRLGEEITNIMEKVAYTERIIKERVGEETFKDTDGDGITDYDETVIYQTDPTSADSDGDGFNDGAEILNNFDPSDPSPEAAVVFESPRNAGLERKDILAVNSINTVRIEKAGENEQAENVPAALIKGKGLPNSFVTLYIFSTPVIVTVKTDAEGNWEYTFDKELEDGEHEIYVGVTDNTGAVMAKSEPLRFIKTAEAYTPVAQAQAEGEITFATEEPGLLTQNMIMLVMSISVIIIGLILLLLGLHLKSRRGEHLIQEGLATGV